MKRARVRVDKTSTSDEVGILDAGQYVHIVFVEGKKGRIVEPLNGWVSMRKNKKAILIQVFNNFEAPTVILSNLDPSLTREKDVLNFLRKQDCRPTRCIWQKKDDFVTVFFTKHKDASKLVRGKFVCNNTELKAVWADGYAKRCNFKSKSKLSFPTKSKKCDSYTTSSPHYIFCFLYLIKTFYSLPPLFCFLHPG
eukprot:UN22955